MEMPRMIEDIRKSIAQRLYLVRVQAPESRQAPPTAQRAVNASHEASGQFGASGQGGGAGVQKSAVAEASRPEGATVVRSGAKVGRNDPCPCGSGKKYKHCHGQ